MKKLCELPNIGKVLEKKLEQAGIYTESDLREAGSEGAVIKIATIDRSAVCLNMLFALEGAIQGIRWHHLKPERENTLKDFFKFID